jgi:hypothetical protein
MNNRPLKAYVRYDGSGRVVSGSLILRKNKPKVGKWKEITAYECCNPPIPTPVYPFALSYGDGNKGSACGVIASNTYETTSTSLTDGVILYTNYALGIVAPDGWYANSDLNDAYEITNGDGVITTTTYCEE